MAQASWGNPEKAKPALERIPLGKFGGRSLYMNVKGIMYNGYIYTICSVDQHVVLQ
jgi:hypothetical protein